MNVAILGASNKPDRYSYKAFKSLQANGHTPLPVHPVLAEIEGVPVHRSLSAVPVTIETITVYLSAANSDAIADEILNCGARRVIFNPGAENPPLETQLQARGIEVLKACTLVLLSTGAF
ncbi:MAG TPA: CoA-binding protein [bacterium]|nr:CoA-binding protein [bacterium]